MDGLVSTGNKISLHNIKKNFFFPKNFFHLFYQHLVFDGVEKRPSSLITPPFFFPLLLFKRSP
jgi:hypothetical protein